MNRLIIAVVALAFVPAAFAQDSPAAPAPQGQRGGGGGGSGQRGGMGGMGGAMGRGITGTVTEVAADHYTIKAATGEIYTVHYSANTRFMKQTAGAGGNQAWQGRRNNQASGGDAATTPDAAGNGPGRMMGGNPPQQIKSTDIKVGDAVAAMGEVDASAKSIGAVAVLQLDPERARQMAQMEANYGKTWLMGRVTAINDVQVTLQGSVDNAPHTFTADENTAFRESNNPITLADIHNNDMVRVDGAIKDGVFTATAVIVMRAPNQTRAPRNGGAPGNSGGAPANSAPPQ